jgi:hypothetical protein
MFGKRVTKTWFALTLAVVLAGLPVAATAAPTAHAQTRTDVLASLHVWWQSWSGVLHPESAQTARREALQNRRVADPAPVAPRLGGGDGAVLRVRGEDSPKMDPDG